MTKFVPRSPDASVNLPQKTPIKDAAQLVGGFIALFVVFYFLLGILVDWGVKYVPLSWEARVFSDSKIVQGKINEKTSEDQKYLQGIVDDLVSKLPDYEKYPEGWFKVRLLEEETVNAFAAPGGQIIVLRGLLKESESENELAMVLGHEIGHSVNRDPLRSMGRGVFMLLVQLVMDSKGSANDFFNASLGTSRNKHSRNQEHKADELGLQLVLGRYGHGAGAVDFFQRAASENSSYVNILSGFVSTHPNPADRVERIREKLSKEGKLKGNLSSLSLPSKPISKLFGK